MSAHAEKNLHRRDNQIQQERRHKPAGTGMAHMGSTLPSEMVVVPMPLILACNLLHARRLLSVW